MNVLKPIAAVILIHLLSATSRAKCVDSFQMQDLSERASLKSVGQLNFEVSASDLNQWFNGMKLDDGAIVADIPTSSPELMIRTIAPRGEIVNGGSDERREIFVSATSHDSRPTFVAVRFLVHDPVEQSQSYVSEMNRTAALLLEFQTAFVLARDSWDTLLGPWSLKLLPVSGERWSGFDVEFEITDSAGQKRAVTQAPLGHADQPTEQARWLVNEVVRRWSK